MKKKEINTQEKIKKNKFLGPTFKEELDKMLAEDDEFRRAYRREQLINLIIYSLVKIRESKKLTQKELAKLLNTKQSCISRLESAKNNKLPSLEFLFSVADALGKEVKVSFV